MVPKVDRAVHWSSSTKLLTRNAGSGEEKSARDKTKNDQPIQFTANQPNPDITYTFDPLFLCDQDAVYRDPVVKTPTFRTNQRRQSGLAFDPLFLCDPANIHRVQGVRLRPETDARFQDDAIHHLPDSRSNPLEEGGNDTILGTPTKDLFCWEELEKSGLVRGPQEYPWRGRMGHNAGLHVTYGPTTPTRPNRARAALPGFVQENPNRWKPCKRTRREFFSREPDWTTDTTSCLENTRRLARPYPVKSGSCMEASRRTTRLPARQVGVVLGGFEKTTRLPARQVGDRERRVDLARPVYKSS